MLVPKLCSLPLPLGHGDLEFPPSLLHVCPSAPGGFLLSALQEHTRLLTVPTHTQKSAVLKSGISQEEPVLQARRKRPGSLPLCFQRSCWGSLQITAPTGNQEGRTSGDQSRALKGLDYALIMWAMNSTFLC